LDGPALVSDLLILADSRPPVDLATLRIPALYAFGDGPAERYYERLATELEATGANVRHRHVPGVGHGIHLSHPQRLADLLSGNLDPQVTVA
jgi:pimeloyl-ACP methyl ester carboxylesterase